MPRATIRFYCGKVGLEYDTAVRLAAEWERKTGVRVEVLETPPSTTDRFSLFLQQLAAEAPCVDLFQIDVVWPGMLGEHFLDLRDHVSDAELARFFPRLVENNTVGGRLVALPWYATVGALFYREDLLRENGFDAPPATWAELDRMAAAIQAAERAKGNAAFWGYSWQGNTYEGLTCNAAEWVASHGGGAFLDARGHPALDRSRAAEALARAASWPATISPPAVEGFLERESLLLFRSGNAAFMRNWPFASAQCAQEDSPVRGKFAVAPLPRGDGPEGRSAATLGGMQIAVSRYSRHPEEAVAFALFLASPEAQRELALAGGYMPTRPALYDEPAIRDASPVLAVARGILETAVSRPSDVAGRRYHRVSAAIWTSCHEALSGKALPGEAVESMTRRLEEAMRDKPRVALD